MSIIASLQQLGLYIGFLIHTIIIIYGKLLGLHLHYTDDMYL